MRAATSASPAGRFALLAMLAVGIAVTVACAERTPEGRRGTTTSSRAASAAGDPRSSTVRVRATCRGVRVGSGILLDSTTVITSRHVVEGATELSLETYAGKGLDVEVVTQTTIADLAVIRISGIAGSGARPARLAAADPRVGSRVRAFGFPDGGAMTVTSGRVTDYVTDPGLGDLGPVMRSDVEVEAGNSGGPVVDDANRVVGLVSAIENESRLSLVIPVSTLRALLDGTLEPVATC